MEVKFEGVNYTYTDKSSKQSNILNNITLTFNEGKISSLIGKSGSGKTTLAELSNALILPTEGKVNIGEYVITNEGSDKSCNINTIRINVGLVFQFPEEQFFNMTVRDEVAFGMKFFNYRMAEMEKRTIDALRMVGLDEEYLDRNPFTLSNGEKRKVAIASILVFNPKVIILDEPTIGLDASSKKSLFQLIRKLKVRYKKNIILISHDIDLVHSISDYVYVINNGNIALEGDKYSVFKQIDKLKECGLRAPKMIEFSNLVLNKKGIKIGYRDEINDLIKDIYRYVK